MHNLNVPINSVSFGVVSIAVLREMHRQNRNVAVFPIGNAVDLSAQKIDNEFRLWLQDKINNWPSYYQRNNPTIKLWHINGAIESIGKEQSLVTFHETDTLTQIESAILKQQHKVFVTSNYTKNVFIEHGINNVEFLELGFDKDNFYSIPQRPVNGVITFGLFGKFEFRKAHAKVLKAWAKAFGNNYKYRLVAAISNPFLGNNPQNAAAELNNQLTQIFDGKRYGNISFLNHCRTNAEYNDIINNIDIVIGCSRGEGRDLPVFHAVGLGKHCVGLNAHAYKDYLNDSNSVLIQPTGMVKAEDGLFFRAGLPFNQGNFFDFAEDDLISACKVAVTRYNSNSVNTNGLKLQEKTYTNTVNILCS